jgi:hypothetical protein
VERAKEHIYEPSPLSQQRSPAARSSEPLTLHNSVEPFARPVLAGHDNSKQRLTMTWKNIPFGAFLCCRVLRGQSCFRFVVVCAKSLLASGRYPSSTILNSMRETCSGERFPMPTAFIRDDLTLHSEEKQPLRPVWHEKEERCCLPSSHFPCWLEGAMILPLGKISRDAMRVHPFYSPFEGIASRDKKVESSPISASLFPPSSLSRFRIYAGL